MVLGSIFAGVATPTEAAALGVLGAFMSSIIYRRLKWRVVWESLTNTFVTTGIVLWIIVASVALSSVYNAIGAQQFVKNLLVGLPGGAYSVLIFMQLTFFFMGCFLDAIGILMIAGPLFIPVAQSLGFDLVWYGIVFAVNMEAAFLTPPFGMNIFLMRGIAPPEIRMSDLYRAIVPFIVLDISILAIVIAFPQLCLWLPTLVFRK
jgi:tripartite ATP-independent transporter DctM subunit